MSYKSEVYVGIGLINIAFHIQKSTMFNLKRSLYLPRKDALMMLKAAFVSQVTGVVTDKDGKAHYVLSGTWDDKMEFSRVMQSSKGENGTEGKQRTVYQTLKAKEIWKKNPLP